MDIKVFSYITIKMQKEEKKEIGITAKKDEDFSEWYQQLILKSDLADYSSVSG